MSDELHAFEAKLAGLVPTGPDTLRDRVVFEAGRRSGHRSTLMWRGLAALFALGMGLSIALQPAGNTSPIVEREPTPAGASLVSRELPALSPVSDSAYLQVRRRVLAEGMGALPAIEPASPSRVRDNRGPDPL
jgi:hypothetical protein